MADTPPASPVVGTGWWDATGGQTYLWFNDGTSSQWVPMSNPSVGPAGPAGPAGSTVASGVTVTPTGNISSTNVQASLAELDSEKVAKAGDTMGVLTITGATAPMLSVICTGSTAGRIDVDAIVGQQSAVVFSEAGTAKFDVGKQGDNTFFIYNEALARYICYTNTGGDLMIQPTGGNVGIGTNVPAAPLHVRPAADQNFRFLGKSDLSSGVMIASLNDANTAGQGLEFYASTFMFVGGVTLGTPTGGDKGNGTLNATAVYANNVLLTSDAALKTDIESLPDCLPLVAAIEPRSFRWKDVEDGPLNRGFLAQEVAYQLGGAATTVDLGGLVAVLWKALQEAMARIEALEQR
jgi:hypothetical protein